MSDVKKIPIDEANYAQLSRYASLQLGLEVKNGMHTAHVRAAIEQAQPGITEIELLDDASAVATRSAPQATQAAQGARAEPAAAAPIPAGRLGGHHRHDPTVKIKLEGSGRRDVRLSVNGVTLTVKPGIIVDLPYRYYLALLQAEETVDEPTGETDPVTGFPIMDKVTRPTVQFSVHGGLPTEDEIAEFHARTDAMSL